MFTSVLTASSSSEVPSIENFARKALFLERKLEWAWLEESFFFFRALFRDFRFFFPRIKKLPGLFFFRRKNVHFLRGKKEKRPHWWGGEKKTTHTHTK